MAKKTSVQREKITILIGSLYLGFIAGFVIAKNDATRKKERDDLWTAIRELRKLNHLTPFTGREAPTMEPMPVRVINDEH